jgi:membrane protein insertase Oxa1/YidC/SpoIIIJ
VPPATPGQPRPADLGVAVAGVMTAVAATLPAGVLLYWATTGLVTVAQQAVLLR